VGQSKPDRSKRKRETTLEGLRPSKGNQKKGKREKIRSDKVESAKPELYHRGQRAIGLKPNTIGHAWPKNIGSRSMNQTNEGLWGRLLGQKREAIE